MYTVGKTRTEKRFWNDAYFDKAFWKKEHVVDVDLMKRCTVAAGSLLHRRVTDYTSQMNTGSFHLFEVQKR